MNDVAEDILLARAYLSRVAEPASVPLWSFVREHGPLEAAQRLRAGDAPQPVLAVTSARRTSADGQADLDAARRGGIRLVVPESDDWPGLAFGALERNCVNRASEPGPAPPLALWVRGNGDLATVGQRAAAIVGARAATSYGEQVASELAYGLALRGVTIVSGGAYGIDAAAHRAALGADAATLIVSAGGLDRPYPQGNAAIFERAEAQGLVVSESPPGTAPHRHRFLTRNRLIAALSTATVVVEAAIRSGALNTAAHCVSQGRPLLVVPGPVTSGMSAGCHALLRREDYQALLVESVDDILAVVGSAGEGLDQTASLVAPDRLREALDQVDVTARRVFDGLPAHAEISVERLAERCGIGVRDVVRAVPALALAGLVERSEDGVRIHPAMRQTRR
jgi:DNA processing protein